jgi:hypothetical protein
MIEPVVNSGHSVQLVSTGAGAGSGAG